MFDHHAVLLVGSSLSETGYFSPHDTLNTEIETLVFETLSIGDVRKIITSAYGKPFERATKTIVIETKSIAIEAQQALLKVLEEPPFTTKFILVVAGKEGLLATLLSRVSQPQIEHATPKPHNELFSIFLQSSYAARLEVIAKITKDKDGERIEFLRTGVESLLLEKKVTHEAAILADSISRLRLRGASKKMLLEEIALTLPLA